jgi:hypothetical protein
MPDQNGNPLYTNIKRAADGLWGANVWFGSHCATNLSRRYYRTRDEAREEDISHGIWQDGCVRIGAYLNPCQPDGDWEEDDHECY